MCKTTKVLERNLEPSWKHETWPTFAQNNLNSDPASGRESECDCYFENPFGQIFHKALNMGGGGGVVFMYIFILFS